MTQTKLALGGRLPDLALPTADGRSMVPLKPGGRLNPVVVAQHGGGCGQCAAYLRDLASAASDLREWDAHVVVVSRDAADAADQDLPFPVVIDADGKFAARTGVEGAAIVIADQWGEVAHVTEAGDDHHLPSAREIVEWVQYLAIQCPECQGEAM